MLCTLAWSPWTERPYPPVFTVLTKGKYPVSDSKRADTGFDIKVKHEWLIAPISFFTLLRQLFKCDSNPFTWKYVYVL